MNDATASRRRGTWLSPLALLLSLTACGPGEGNSGSMRMKVGEDWKEFELETVRTYDSVSTGFPIGLFLCGKSKAPEEQRGLCLDLEFQSGTLGSGPADFSIDGSATMSPRRLPPDEAFRTGPAHSQGLVRVSVSRGCWDSHPDGDAVHKISGQLELEENSVTKLQGSLELETTGPSGGDCLGSAIDADLHFDLLVGTNVQSSP